MATIAITDYDQIFNEIDRTEEWSDLRNADANLEEIVQESVEVADSGLVNRVDYRSDVLGYRKTTLYFANEMSQTIEIWY